MNALIFAGDDEVRGNSTITPYALAPINIATGAGNDTVYASGADDFVYGGDGDDLILAFPGSDPLFSRPGSSLYGGNGSDTVTGGRFDDFIIGDRGSDRLTGAQGNDTIVGGAGRDRVMAGKGNDLIIVSAGEIVAGEIIDGGEGNDTLSVFGSGTAPVDLSRAALSGIETLDLSGSLNLTRAQYAGLQRIEFNGFVTLSFADGGLIDLPALGQWYARNPLAVMTVQAGATDDIINGRDTIDVAPPAAGFVAYGAGDVIRAGAGNDAVNGGSGNDTLTGENGNDSLNGEAGADVLSGEAGEDVLDGGSGNDSAYGGIGNDVLTGGSGADVLDGGGEIDWASYADAETAVTASLLAPASNAGNAAGDVYVGIENLRGSDWNDRLTGNTAANMLEGLDGKDTLYGQNGNDSLSGGIGNDSLRGGNGADTLIGRTGADRFIFVTLTESAPAIPDLITDFSQIEGDRIDLLALIPGTFALSVGGGPLGGGVASVWIGAGAPGTTLVHVDTGNGGTDEMTVILNGSLALGAASFLL